MRTSHDSHDSRRAVCPKYQLHSFGEVNVGSVDDETAVPNGTDVQAVKAPTHGVQIGEPNRQTRAKRF